MAARILVVTYFYPPDVSVGSLRWPPLARALRELGHEVTVLTTSAFGALADDEPWVVRTRDLEAPGLARRLLRRPPAPLTAGGAAAPGAAAPRMLTDGPVPDAKVISWLPFVVPALRRLVAERGIECVISNGPPDSTHLAPLALGPRGRRPAWLVDLEDGWRFEPQRFGWPTRAQDRLDAALEARVLRSADGVVSVTRPVLEDAAARFGARTQLVPIAMPAQAPASAAPQAGQDTVAVVHTGALSHPQRRDPTAFFEGLRRLVARDPVTPVRLVLAGGLTAADKELLDALEPAVAGRVDRLGPLPREQALALQRSADALLLVTTGPQRSSVTGKLFEYLAAGRPVLALAGDNEAARIVAETGAGLVVSPDDPDAVADALALAAGGGLPYAPRGLDAYRMPAVARAMSTAVASAVALACSR